MCEESCDSSRPILKRVYHERQSNRYEVSQKPAKIYMCVFSQKKKNKQGNVLCQSAQTYYKSLIFRYSFLCSSKNKKVAIVCGPKRTNAGTHPLNIHDTPSLRYISRNRCINPPLLSEGDALMTLVLITSTGLHTVVATKPADIEAVKCVERLSGMPNWSVHIRLKMS